eukprot:CAMPEP_0172371686 /NCGR_PEP_ID=MMETSP1060-20121228/44339_1 /TAXON_ID=37318 /ORGANISM="Pseudo-nitzschia pungens, Strain cf. cingulata" /LENGTH=557 /DNA_ID=CAMNT_0013097405 /DNA_START=86 /DNA_END=1759 /DNA_ORIENTATION=+
MSGHTSIPDPALSNNKRQRMESEQFAMVFRSGDCAELSDAMAEQGLLRIPKVPPGGYVDNPTEVNQFLSQHYLLKLNHMDVRNLAFFEEENKSNHEKDAHSQVDNLLSKSMLQTTREDRNSIIEEIHGVQNLAPKESPEMISFALQELASELSMIPPQARRALDRSLQLAPNSYIHSVEFWLRFLRCDLFDAQRAAIRMVQFLDLLAELFGDVALERPIMLKDFSRDEIQAFRVGHQQLLPYRDRSGRRVYACVGGLGLEVPLLTRVKILVYIILAASEDLETQRKGLISIIWPGTNIPSGDNTSNLKFDRIMFMKRVYENLPLRMCSIHFCFASSQMSSPFERCFRTVAILTMPHYLKRMKFHYGESVELLYALKAFGIPAELIPLTDTGNIKTTYLKQWMKLRRIMDSVRETGDNRNQLLNFIECPGLHDVVFRTGTSMYCHPGNVRFRCLMEQKHENPVYASKRTRGELALQIIEEIEADGGRFLKWDNRSLYWTEIDQMQIHNKVLLAIRDFKYKTKAKRANLQQMGPSNKSFMFLSQGEHGCSQTSMCSRGL